MNNQINKIIEQNLKNKAKEIAAFQQGVKTLEDALLKILPMLPDFKNKETIMKGLKFQPKVSDFRRYQLPREGKKMHENKLFIIWRFKKHDWIVAKEQIDKSIFEEVKNETK